VKRIDYNFRSACALGIISCFVLFLTASAPHRVHHLFENPQADEVTRAHTHKTAYPLLLTALGQSADSGDHNHPSGDHEKSLGKDGHQGHVRGSHHGYASGNNHDRGRQHQGRAESQVDGESDGNGSDTPLQQIRHTMTRIMTTLRKRSVCFKALHNIHIYQRRNR
jgi:hypothetical protein